MSKVYLYHWRITICHSIWDRARQLDGTSERSKTIDSQAEYLSWMKDMIKSSGIDQSEWDGGFNVDSLTLLNP